MWKKITLVNGDGDVGHTASRLPDEIFEGDFAHAKTLIALQSFENVREMYIQNMDPDNDSDPIDVYRVISGRGGKVDFLPWSFDIHKLEKCFPNKEDQASIQLAAMMAHRRHDSVVGKQKVHQLEEIAEMLKSA